VRKRVPSFLADAVLPPRPDEGRFAAEVEAMRREAVKFSRLPDRVRFRLLKQGRVPPTPPGWKMYEDGTFGPPPKPLPLGPPAPPPPGSLWGGVSVAHPYKKHA
jgi:hypothetical protein